jgi:hypothetical protein
MPRVPASHVYVVKELDDFLQTLSVDHKFRKWVADMKIVLKENKFSGELIKKNRIPKYYIEKFGVSHLYRYDHPEGHRSCYAIIEGCPRIFDIMTHAEYELRFGYNTT